MREIMSAMEQGRVGPLLDAMHDDVVWHWRGAAQWSRSFTGRQVVIDVLFGGATDSLGAGSSVTLHHVHADGEVAVVEHTGHNELPDGRSYDNNYCWVVRFDAGRIVEVREYMDTQLVTETFGPDAAD